MLKKILLPLLLLIPISGHATTISLTGEYWDDNFQIDISNFPNEYMHNCTIQPFVYVEISAEGEQTEEQFTIAGRTSFLYDTTYEIVTLGIMPNINLESYTSFDVHFIDFISNSYANEIVNNQGYSSINLSGIAVYAEEINWLYEGTFTPHDENCIGFSYTGTKTGYLRDEN